MIAAFRRLRRACYVLWLTSLKEGLPCFVLKVWLVCVCLAVGQLFI